MSIHCKLVILILALTFDSQVHTGQIFNGHETVPHSRPYMVFLEQHLMDGNTSYCDGFLLNEDFVMTAAHCQDGSINVWLGVHDWHNKNEAQRVTVEHKFPHQDYNSRGYLNNDIMLLKLSSKVNFSEHVKPIALAGPGDGSLPKSCVVSGWGKTKKTPKHGSPVLLEVNVTLFDNEMCEKEYFYCSEGEAGPREGDSGGPLVCEDGKAYGVVSTSGKTPNGVLIYAYAKISAHVGWIFKTMKNATKMPLYV